MHGFRIAVALSFGIVAAGSAAAQPAGEPGTDAAPDAGASEPSPETMPAPEPAATPGTPPVEVAGSDRDEIVDVDVAPRWDYKLFGYLRLQAGVVQNDPNVAFVGRDDGFALQNARLGIEATLWRKTTFVLSFDGAVDERDRVNDPDGTLRVGLRDAFVDLHLGAVDVRAGRFDPVFDPEHLYSDIDRPFVDRALESRGTRPTEGWQNAGLPPGRSIGIAVRRVPDPTALGPAAGFELAVQNGADEFSADNDNDLPAVSAAALVALRRGIELVAAVRWNARTEGELPFQQDETDLQGAAGARIELGRVHVGLGAIVVHTIFDTTGGPAQNAFGGHAQVLVGLGTTRMPIAVGYRFAILDPSDLILTDRLMEHTAGAVLGLPAWFMRAQLNVTHVMEQAARDLSNDRVEAALEVAF